MIWHKLAHSRSYRSGCTRRRCEGKTVQQHEEPEQAARVASSDVHLLLPNLGAPQQTDKEHPCGASSVLSAVSTSSLDASPVSSSST
jgi:hypothetical protein